MKAKMLAITAMLVVTLLTPVITEANALGPDQTHFFSETGYVVDDPFLSYWNENGGLPIFGHPISHVQVHGDLKVQYFENALLELHPDGKIRGAHVGLFAYRQYLLEQGNHIGHLIYHFLPGDVRYFPETSRNVHGAFLAFWEVNGGLQTFGYPVSIGFIDKNGKYTQYFERSQFTYHPNDLINGEVVNLEKVGQKYLDQLNLTRELH